MALSLNEHRCPKRSLIKIVNLMVPRSVMREGKLARVPNLAVASYHGTLL